MFYNKILQILKSKDFFILLKINKITKILKIKKLYNFLKDKKISNNSTISGIESGNARSSENFNVSDAINEAFDGDEFNNKNKEGNIDFNEIDQLGKEEKLKKKAFLFLIFLTIPRLFFWY